MRSRKVLSRAALYVLAALIVLAFLTPILLIFFGSLRDPIEFFRFPPSLSSRFTLRNYAYALSEQVGLSRYMFNSAFYAIASTLIALAIGLPASYAMSRRRGHFTRAFIYVIVVIRAIPPISLLVPLYAILTSVQLTGTYAGLLIAYVGFHLPFVIWLMRGFFADIDQELIDAAHIDGCSKGGAFMRVAFPLSVPSIVVVSIFCFIGSWNELLYAIVLTTKDTGTAPVFIGSFYSDTGASYGMLYSSSSLTIIPLLIMTLFLQRYIVKGLSFGGVKE